MECGKRTERADVDIPDTTTYGQGETRLTARQEQTCFDGHPNPLSVRRFAGDRRQTLGARFLDTAYISVDEFCCGMAGRSSGRDGRITLADGSVLKLRLFILGIKETGFSPFGGVSFSVFPVAGIIAESVPEELRGKVRDRPPAPPILPEEGWEMIEIEHCENASEEQEVDSSKGRFKVKVEAEPLMVARNMLYKAALGLDEPFYYAYWAYKASWRRVEQK